MGFKYQIPENAEVISSIGVALAMVREMVERTIPNPTAQDIAQLKKEAKELAMNSGAVEDSIEVYVEIDAVSYTHLDVYKRQVSADADPKYIGRHAEGV